VPGGAVCPPEEKPTKKTLFFRKKTAGDLSGLPPDRLLAVARRKIRLFFRSLPAFKSLWKDLGTFVTIDKRPKLWHPVSCLAVFGLSLLETFIKRFQNMVQTVTNVSLTPCSMTFPNSVRKRSAVLLTRGDRHGGQDDLPPFYPSSVPVHLVKNQMEHCPSTESK